MPSSFRLPWLAMLTMTREDSELLESRSERPEMSSVAEMSALVREVADFTAQGSNWKERVHAAARALHMPFGRTKRHYYGEARRVDAEEMDRARDTAARLRAAEHVKNLNRTAAYLRSIDPELYAPAIAGIERGLAAAGVLDCAVDEADK